MVWDLHVNHHLSHPEVEQVLFRSEENIRRSCSNACVFWTLSNSIKKTKFIQVNMQMSCSSIRQRDPHLNQKNGFYLSKSLFNWWLSSVVDMRCIKLEFVVVISSLFILIGEEVRCCCRRRQMIMLKKMKTCSIFLCLDGKIDCHLIMMFK